MGQSGFIVKKRNLSPLLSFSALLVCILPHCRLRDWCGNLRKASGHVIVASTNQRHSAFLIPHFTFRIPQFRILPIAVRRVLKIPADTHSYLLPLLMDMLTFTDYMHKRSASVITACLKSGSTRVRSIAEFVIVGRCMKAGWNCFRMVIAVRSSVELVMASALRRTSPTYVASRSSSLDAVAGVGSVYSVY